MHKRFRLYTTIGVVVTFLLWIGFIYILADTYEKQVEHNTKVVQSQSK